MKRLAFPWVVAALLGLGRDESAQAQPAQALIAEAATAMGRAFGPAGAEKPSHPKRGQAVQLGPAA